MFNIGHKGKSIAAKISGMSLKPSRKTCPAYRLTLEMLDLGTHFPFGGTRPIGLDRSMDFDMGQV